MSLKAFARAWNRFFFEPQSPVPIALFRIILGIIVLCDALLLRPQWLTWFGPHGLVSLKAMQQIETGVRINLFPLLPETEFWTNAIFVALVVSAMLLCAGLFTRVSSIAVFVLLASIHERNIFILNSGDTLLRVSAFFLMFAPAGAALSLDRLRRIWRGTEGPERRLYAPWAQRMIQIELSLLYLMTFLTKSEGPAWIDGTALYYVYHLDQFRRFPVPGFLQDLFLIRLQTWLTLAAEFALGVLVWFQELRYPILLLGVVLHLSLEYSMNVPMFQWTTLALYVTFVDGADLARLWSSIRAQAVAWMPQPVVVAYNPEMASGRRAAEVLRAVDIFGRLHLVHQRGPLAAGALQANGVASILGIARRLWGFGSAPRPAPNTTGNPIPSISAR